MIFISHSSKDVRDARDIAEALREAGFNELFLDIDHTHGLAPGAEWLKQLREAMTKANAIVLLITRHWLGSAWCLSEYRAALLAEKKKLIVPVLMEAVSIDDLPIDLASIQCCDLSRDRKQALPTLLKALRNCAPAEEHSPSPSKISVGTQQADQIINAENIETLVIHSTAPKDRSKLNPG